MIRILFFAGLREQLDCDGLEIPAAGLRDVARVRAALGRRGERWQVALQRPDLQVAVNQALAADASPVQPGDEVAFFPPVTGG
ncbi:molybdopterin converting factor subunit 1 [Microbulbifer sediminum]|uniref:molybdopterin converting factor subunit 1 n=1 Tax=Microbulbifer sediminum TaxID=2904250 RepID=UPI001F01E99E|nr:molybdopterin converting factor subunit 1 [Microbulbifer sediminum]